MWILGIPNHFAQSYAEFAVIDSSFQPADMGVSLLGTEEPTERARLTTLDPYLTQWGFGTSGIPSRFDGLALANHNIEYGGQVRFVGWNNNTSVDGAFVIPTRKIASSIVTSTNRTGAVTDIDEDMHAPDGLSMGPTTNTSAWSVTLGFTSLAGTINAGTGLFSLVFRARRLFSGAGATAPLTLPLVTAYINGVSFGYRAVTSTVAGGQIFIFPFSRADFGSLTSLQVKLDFTPGLSNSGGQYAILETLNVYYETVSATSPTHDSLWIDVPGDSRPGPSLRSRKVHYFPSTAWTGITAVGVMIRSDQALRNPLKTSLNLVPVSLIPREPPTFVQAGVAPAGEGLHLSYGMTSPGAPATKMAIEEVSGSTSTGQSYGMDAWRRRASDPVQVLVTRAEKNLLQDQIAARRGHSGAVYVAMEPGVALADQDASSFWSTVKEVSSPQWAGHNGTTDTYLMSLTFEEKL